MSRIYTPFEKMIEISCRLSKYNILKTIYGRVACAVIGMRVFVRRGT
jgi:hypothetical protein